MKILIPLLAAAMLCATTACKTPVSAEANYVTPTESFSGGFSSTTNGGVTLTGAVQKGTTNVNTTVTIGK